MSDWYLYLVRCGDDSLYTGITTDIPRRLEMHANNKGAKYLRGRGPLRLVYSARIGDRASASRVEYRIKQLDRKQKEALADGRLSLTALLEINDSK